MKTANLRGAIDGREQFRWILFHPNKGQCNECNIDCIMHTVKAIVTPTSIPGDYPLFNVITKGWHNSAYYTVVNWTQSTAPKSMRTIQHPLYILQLDILLPSSICICHVYFQFFFVCCSYLVLLGGWMNNGRVGWESNQQIKVPAVYWVGNMIYTVMSEQVWTDWK